MTLWNQSLRDSQGEHFNSKITVFCSYLYINGTFAEIYVRKSVVSQTEIENRSVLHAAEKLRDNTKQQFWRNRWMYERNSLRSDSTNVKYSNFIVTCLQIEWFFNF